MVGNMSKQSGDMKRGDRIRDIRCNIGLSQDEAADRMHISRQSLSSIENGGDFRISVLCEMMKVYNVTSDEIMTDIHDNMDVIVKINTELGKMDERSLEQLYISLHAINQSKEM